MVNDKANYFDLVYQVVKEIPAGRVTNYGTIANYLGLRSGARMVGYAMNAAHTLSDVPAHRVVNASGLLTGKNHFATPTLMQELLEQEGVKISKDKVVDFEGHFWDPELELKV